MPRTLHVYQQAASIWFGCVLSGPDEIPDDAGPGMAFTFGGRAYQIETWADRCAIAAEQVGDLSAARQLHPVLLLEALDHAFPPGHLPNSAFFVALTGVLSNRPNANRRDVVAALHEGVERHRARQGRTSLWLDMGEGDYDVPLAALVAAQRCAVLPRGALAEYLAKHCFAQGQQYLTEVEGGLFARLVVEGQDVIIYEVEDRENA